MVKIPVEGDLLYRWIKSAGDFVDMSRGIIADKSPESGNDHAVVAE